MILLTKRGGGRGGPEARPFPLERIKIQLKIRQKYGGGGSTIPTAHHDGYEGKCTGNSHIKEQCPDLKGESLVCSAETRGPKEAMRFKIRPHLAPGQEVGLSATTGDGWVVVGDDNGWDWGRVVRVSGLSAD